MNASEFSPDEISRLRKTVDSIPDTVKTGLEIGFYDLRLSALLRGRVDMVSIDLPRNVETKDGYKLAFADLRALPFRDNSFDITICTEVLEHLPEEVLSKGVKELLRVSRKYVLVSVPYKQRIWNEMFKCANCGFVGNSMGHVNYMDENTLTTLFKVASLQKAELVGKVEDYAPDWLYWSANKLGNSWCDYMFGNCPKCEQSDVAAAPNPIGYVIRRLIWRIERAAGSRPSWILALFKMPDVMIGAE